MYMRRTTNWFVDLFGFQESCDYEEVQNSFRVKQRVNRLTGRIENVLELASSKKGEMQKMTNSGSAFDSWSVGRFRTPSLGELRGRNVHVFNETDEDAYNKATSKKDNVQFPSPSLPKTRLKLMIVTGDITKIHGNYENCGCVIQVASQFNCLEMIPEHGVTAYASDRTQGPACCLCTQPAIVYRNYLMDWSQLFEHDNSSLPLEGDTVTENKEYGQRADHQLDNADDLRAFLEEQIGSNEPLFWTQNGYMIANRDQLNQMQLWYSQQMMEKQQGKDGKRGNSLLDKAKSLLKIGIHEDIEVTHCGEFGQKKIEPSIPTRNARQCPKKKFDEKMYVTHALCSACAINYNRRFSTQQDWQGLARVILESTYESTLFAAVEARQRWNPNYDFTTSTTCNLPFPGAKKVFLTLVGGGVFGNDPLWILDAIEKACLKFRHEDLEVYIVCYSEGVKTKIQGQVKDIQGKLTSTF